MPFISNFTGTADGKKSPEDYFKQYITRDVVSIVGYQDTKSSGDQYCMAKIQGGDKRRDRNLIWWQYVNTLARTNEDLNGFPGTFDGLPDWSSVSNNNIAMRLVVVEDAAHDADEVFSGKEGRAALFSSGDLPTGWRPDGWKPASSNTLKSPSSSQAALARTSSPSSSSDTTSEGDYEAQKDTISGTTALGMPILAATLTTLFISSYFVF